MSRTPLAILLMFFAFLPGQALAHDGPPGPDGLPEASSRHAWKYFQGASRADTVAAAWREVLPAARRALEEDDWTIFTSDTARGELVTTWKALHHPLLWLFVGKVEARCTVEVRSLGPCRTRIALQGALASHHDIESSPIFGRAKRAYATAARKFHGVVRQDLSDRRLLCAAVP